MLLRLFALGLPTYMGSPPVRHPARVRHIECSGSDVGAWSISSELGKKISIKAAEIQERHNVSIAHNSGSFPEL